MQGHLYVLGMYRELREEYLAIAQFPTVMNSHFHGFPETRHSYSWESPPGAQAPGLHSYLWSSLSVHSASLL